MKYDASSSKSEGTSRFPSKNNISKQLPFQKHRIKS